MRILVILLGGLALGLVVAVASLNLFYGVGTVIGTWVAAAVLFR